MSVSDWFSEPDYTGSFQPLVDKWDRDGDWGGNALRYSIFSTLNDGPNHPAYRGRLEMARDYYGLQGSPENWETIGHRSPSGVFQNYQESVVQPTVGTWMSLTSWLYWFKVGFTGF